MNAVEVISLPFEKQGKAVSGFHHLLSEFYPDLNNQHKPEAFQKELGHIALCARQADTRTLLDHALNMCYTTSIQPPDNPNDMVQSLQHLGKLRDHFDGIYGKHLYVVDTLISAVEAAIKKGDADTSSDIGVILGSFATAMEAFGMKAPSKREIQSIDRTELKPRNAQYHPPKVNRVSAEIMPIEVVGDVTIDMINQEKWATPSAKLSDDLVGMVVSLPVTINGNEGSEKAQTELTYKISIAVEKSPGVWERVMLSPPIHPTKYDAGRHLSWQLQDFWTANLPPQGVRWVAIIEQTPWQYTHETVSQYRREIKFINPEDDRNLSETLARMRVSKKSLIGATLLEAFETVGSDTHLRANRARVIFDQLQAQKPDLLDIPMKVTDKIDAYQTDFYMSYCARIGTDTHGHGSIPVVMRLDRQGKTARELMQHAVSPQDLLDAAEKKKDPESAEQLGILQVLGLVSQAGELAYPEGENGDTRYVVYHGAQTHVAKEKQSSDAEGEQTDVTLSELWTAPISRDESLAKGEGWVGNQLTVVPTLVHSYPPRSVHRENEVPDIQTLRDVLRYCMDQDQQPIKIGESTPVVVWESTFIPMTLEVMAPVGYKNLLPFQGGSDPGLKSLRFQPQRSWAAAEIELRQRAERTEGEVHGVVGVAQLSPVTLRLIVPEEKDK